MSTQTPDQKADQATAPKAPVRDDYKHLESLDQLGLVHDKDDHLTPVDALFNAKEASIKPKGQPRQFL